MQQWRRLGGLPPESASPHRLARVQAMWGSLTSGTDQPDASSTGANNPHQEMGVPMSVVKTALARTTAPEPRARA